LIVADTNVISTFSRVGALDHLRQLVKAERIHVTPATFNELRRAVEAGCDFLTATLTAIQDVTELDSYEVGPGLSGIADWTVDQFS
jgi:predicted nucleic acid-binding protein